MLVPAARATAAPLALLAPLSRRARRAVSDPANRARTSRTRGEIRASEAAPSLAPVLDHDEVDEPEASAHGDLR
jgi:hypothetical protein